MEIAEEPKKSAFSRSTWDTSALIFIGVSFFMPLLYLVGIVMVWISKRWTTGEKVFATVAAPTFILAVIAISRANAGLAEVFIAMVFAGPITAFALAFRMGRREIPA